MSKKLLGILLLVGVLGLAASPALAAEEPPTSCTIRKQSSVVDIVSDCGSAAAPDGECTYDSSDAPCALCCLLGTIIFVSDILFAVLMIVVTMAVLYGAFLIVTAGGNDENITKGRKWIMRAIIGVAVALLVKAIPNLLGFFIA